MEDNDRRALIESAVLGKESEEFLTSAIGQYLISRVENEIESARQSLESVSPWRRRRISDLQARIWRAQSFKGWLAELIIDGHNATKIITGEDDAA